MPELSHVSTPLVLSLMFLAVVIWLHGWFVGRRARVAAHAAAKPIEDSSTIEAAIARAVEGLRAQVTALELRRAGADQELIAQVRGMERSARDLATALRTPHTRGRWGELHLRRAVEAAGMSEHCDFLEQASVTDADGIRRRPDLLVRLAGGRVMVVDAKAPMEAWLAALDHDDVEARDREERRHAAAVREHVRALAARRYPQSIASAAPLVVLYLPGEDLLRAALQHDARLLDDAARLDIVIATPSSLISILRGIALGWRETGLAHNAEQISRLGSTLHDRIGVVNDHLAKLGRALDSSVRAFDETVGSVEARLLPTARGLRELDAGGSRTIDPVTRIEHRPRTRESA